VRSTLRDELENLLRISIEAKNDGKCKRRKKYDCEDCIWKRTRVV